MKVSAFVLFFLQLAIFIDVGVAQCATGWAGTQAGGQCMQCSGSGALSGATDTTFVGAQAYCKAVGGNLATIINTEQEDFAYGCRTVTVDPWIGYTGTPIQGFLDGTSFVNYGVILTPTFATVLNCYVLDTVRQWDEETTSCIGPRPFACSRPYDWCYDLEVPSVTLVAYSHADTSTPWDGTRWVRTVATYSCRYGYSLIGGTNRRICNSDGSWTGSAPECVVAAVCWGLTEPSDSTLSYSTAASGSSYTAGTVATQVCNTGYEKKSGSDSRP